MVSIAEATAAAGRILSVRKYGPENELARMPPGKSPAKVEFKNVYFTYKDRDVPVLQGINLKVRKNHKISPSY
jgi:ABC-type bacteriocin/lantibiotic exporter with double-glycine peptidase domain